eukprot:6285073-Amphidinium_carterae.1
MTLEKEKPVSTLMVKAPPPSIALHGAFIALFFPRCHNDNRVVNASSRGFSFIDEKPYSPLNHDIDDYYAPIDNMEASAFHPF